MATPGRQSGSSSTSRFASVVHNQGSSSPVVHQSFTAMASSVTGPSPRKRTKVEEMPPASEEIAAKRRLIQGEKLSKMLELKESYFDHLTECFFLQNGGQLMDYYPWRKKPTPQLVQFLKSGRLDSDDEEENPVIYLKESKATEEVKAGSSTENTGAGEGLDNTSIFNPDLAVPGLYNPAPVLGQETVVSAGMVPGRGSFGLSVSHDIHRSASDSRLLTLGSHGNKAAISGYKKLTLPSPGALKQTSYDGTVIKGISSQEAIVERAKQEAQVMSRVAELRKEGLWSSRRLPKVQEPPRPKAHWDYLLEEMQWLAADFQQERKWKKTCARKIAKMVQKYFQDIEQRELKAEKEESMKLKRIAGQMAKMVKEFWSNIEKVVQYKQNSRLDEKRKKAMDLHLNFIVNQTEQYSNWLSEGLAQSSKGSSAGSLNTTPAHSVAGDDEFQPEGSESDDEETIEKDEEGIDEGERRDEVAALQKESELPIDQLIDSLPKEILEKPATIHSDSEDEPSTSKKDEEFEAEHEDESDIEETIEEQEGHEKADHAQELQDLENEGDMDIEALRAKYAAAYDSDFEMPKDSGDESTDIDDSDEEESTEIEESEEEEEEDQVDVEEGDVGLEALMSDKDTTEKDKAGKAGEDTGPVGQELTDIAAQAASLQPKGYTLQTAEVKTAVPFLIRHTLREYQHVGLDWLATMYEKRLNGILADEMGLGKTIQTIALLAHLACEKGIWGPHLIVVPTSVMLNWEMECKKWCPAFKILTYYGSQKERKQKRQGWTKTNAFHICITSYKLVIQDHNSFRRKKWKYLILDEAQNIKNFKSQRWQCLLNFNSMRRLLLTGTPLQNSLMELWSLMHFLMPHVFQSHKDFKEWFANPLTGMIEGSHEYNESLVRRLHKVLRPFLLRRLKDDVEKQMPKKYEHVVMCHLSKRQRFLYDEFMAQGKTKETLATGHFMSVINILMQLRKVCNHPSLFDPRPIVSPFQMEGLVYNTASLVLQVMKYDPLENIELHRYPGLAEMERDLPAFIAHRVRKLQTGRRLIQEIDIQPRSSSRPHPGKLKTSAIKCVPPQVQHGVGSPSVHSRSVSPAPMMKPVSSATTQSPLQSVVVTQSTGVSIGQPVSSSQPITVQIRQTDQGARLVVPSNQLTQLPGLIHLVQTSTGQTIPTSNAVTTTTLVNGSPAVTMASSSLRTAVSSSVSRVKMSSEIQSGTGTQVQLPTGAGNQGQKPIMRVSPLSDGQKHQSSVDGLVFTTASTTSSMSYVMSGSSKPVAMVTPSPQMIKHLETKKKLLSKKEFFLEPLYDKKQCVRQERLQYLARTNKNHSEKKPVYGQDLCDAVNIFKDPFSSKTYKNRDLQCWHGPGHIHCQCAKLCENLCHPKYLWNQTSVLSETLHTPEEYLQELSEILDRFVFVTPPVQSQLIKMHTSHPPPPYKQEQSYRENQFRTELSPKTANYHKICTKMTVQFPELRLIQYDCGKLQTLDILLHRLKTGDHRVLIFTQMTRMLDILEAFLNYHGHRYLRLDGTTKIEQRQQRMDRFNADRRIFCFILSTRSGGIGVNLTGADSVIFYDSDWNPTMDAQAQDRCHRIGQTRDVHIYRLVSEKTVEENILKKANQKRMLGDMAIEGGNFTTAFFKQNTIDELFSEPSGLESLVKEKEAEEKAKREKATRAAQKKADQKKVDPSEQQALVQFEKALANTEDETDAVAIEQVKAEQKEELAEFDENIPWEEGERRDEESHVELELAMLDKELTPIERYAVQLTEQMMEPVNVEELKIAEEDIEAVKKDWELNRLKALKEEEEKRAELEEDEMLYTYSRDDAYQQVKKRNKQLAVEAKRAAEKLQALSGLSPRKAASLGVNVNGEGDQPAGKKEWVYRTPKIIKDLVRNRNLPEGAMNDEKNKRKSKLKVRVDDDSDIDVETVDLTDEATPGKIKIKRKVDKPVVKRPRKNSKGDTPVKNQRGALNAAVSSTEATRLDSLPGFTIPAPVREGLFQKLHSPPKSVASASRANIFEQFGLQPPSQATMPGGISFVQQPGQPPVFQNQIAGNTVRLINTPQGRQMVVVSSSSVQQNPQNVVLLQGMQGFPQGIVVGNNIVSLTGGQLNLAQMTRPGTPVNIQTPRLVGTPQIVNSKFGARIVSPVVGAAQQNPAFVQRFVTGQQVLPGTAIQVPQLNQVSPPQVSAGNLPQMVNIPQFRLNSPLVHTTGGHVVSLQSAPTVPQQRKSSVQTIANLIAAGKTVKQSPSPVIPQQAPSSRPAVNLPNLANLMRAQIPSSLSSPSIASHPSPLVPTQSQVRVNPAVAKLVASHIHNICANSSQTTQSISATRTPSPAVINLAAATSRSQSPTVVKVVSVSRTASPSTLTGPVVSKPIVPPMQRGASPVATINIKGLPPGVSIPASLVNSLVSGSIGGISKGGLRGVAPAATASAPKKTVVRLAQPFDVNASINERRQPVQNHVGQVNNATPKPSIEVRTPVQNARGIQPVTASASPPTTMQAWSNPNLVIRTRRGAVKSPVVQARSPQVGPSPKAPAPVEGIGSPKANGPSSLGNHVSMNIQPATVPVINVKQIDENKNTGENTDSNGGVDIIEIS